jgi:predicted enzyme related to lactoylglutathione lyase
MADDSIRGHFVWHELMTTDTKSAASFFTKIIGWKTQPFPQDPSYTMFVTDRPMAGLMPLPDGGKGMGGRPVWLSYIGTPSVDDTARQAEKLGGKILKQPADIPTVGRFAVLADPQGAVFNAFTPLPMEGSQPPVERAAIGDFSWHELPTTDWRAALTFYKALFGWEETSAMDMGPMGTYQMFGLGGRPFGGIFNKPKEMQGPPAWLPYIHVHDAKKVAVDVKKQGGQVISGPMEVPGGDWIVTGLDLQGAMFAVHSVTKQPAAKKPAAKKPAAKKPAAKKPAAKKAAAKKTAPKKPATKAAK